ncbi:MAG: carboxypeptidase-like regulatory domain-containing protein, partial [Vicinamibacteraceae bacterium]
MALRVRTIVAMALALWAAPASAQVTTSTILGTVTDPSGGVLPGVQITVTDSATGSVRTTRTGVDGGYVVENLKPGDYVIATVVSGFKDAVVSGITVQVAQRARVDITLELGSASDRVEVVARAPVIQT